MRRLLFYSLSTLNFYFIVVNGEEYLAVFISLHVLFPLRSFQEQYKLPLLLLKDDCE